VSFKTDRPLLCAVASPLGRRSKIVSRNTGSSSESQRGSALGSAGNRRGPENRSEDVSGLGGIEKGLLWWAWIAEARLKPRKISFTRFCRDLFDGRKPASFISADPKGEDTDVLFGNGGISG